MSIKRGDIYYIENFPTVGSEQQPGRPAVVVSNDTCNKTSTVVEIVYLTMTPKTDMPTHTTIRSTGRTSTALCEQITSVSVSRLGDYIGAVTKDELLRIDTAMMISLGIEGAPDAPEPSLAKIEPMPNAELLECKAQLEVYKRLYSELLERIAER